MKLLSSITLFTLISMAACSHHHKGHSCCEKKDHCSKEGKKQCDKCGKEECKDGSCDKKKS